MGKRTVVNRKRVDFFQECFLHRIALAGLGYLSKEWTGQKEDSNAESAMQPH